MSLFPDCFTPYSPWLFNQIGARRWWGSPGEGSRVCICFDLSMDLSLFWSHKYFLFFQKIKRGKAVMARADPGVVSAPFSDYLLSEGKFPKSCLLCWHWNEFMPAFHGPWLFSWISLFRGYQAFYKWPSLTTSNLLWSVNLIPCSFQHS